ncbi:MAG TPA: diguanylate cyclase, partial [Myxococcales bacterium]
MEDANYRELVENASDIIYAHDLEGRFTWVNRACERVTGYTRDETLRLRIWDLVAPEYRSAMEKNLSGEMQTFEVEVLAKDGRRIPLELKSRLVYRGQMPVGVQGIARDITERRRAEEAMRESEERYALAALGSNDGLWDWDLRENKIFLSARWKEQLGAAETELGDDPDQWFERIHPDDRQRLFGDLGLHLEGRTPHFQNEHRLRHLDGSWRWMLVRGAAVRDAAGKAYRLAGSQTDITERKLAEEKLLHDALHDGLTGLPNRSLFMDRLGQALAFQQRRSDYRFAVLFLDVDRFKTVNESLGHTQGDVLLVQIARRLREMTHPGDTVARLGGDEFALLLGDFADPEEPVRTAERMQEALSTPYDLDGTEVFTTASIGVAVGSRAYSRPEELLRDADTAMYRAKDLGRARHAVFHPAMHAHAQAQLRLDTDLRR